jgi:nitrate reductase NapAB chaperone NapD
MPIKSYLAHPHDGKKEMLINAISQLSNCEVIPAENKNLLIVVTDTDNKIEDEQLKETIEALDSLKLLALVSGFNAPKNNV